MIFKVKYSTDKDIQNHLKSSWKFSYSKFGRKNIKDKLLASYPEDFKENLKKAKTPQEAEIVIGNFLSSLPKNFHNTTPLIALGVEQTLNENAHKIEDSLTSAYKKPVPFDKVTVYLTTCNIYPYNFKECWFMSSRNASAEGHIRIANHELNHFMFYYYYPELKKELGEKKYEILKEALAIFTNSEGNDKPEVKNLESYFRKNLSNTIEEVLKKNEWKRYF